MNPETAWTYTHIYAAELYTPRNLHRVATWRDAELGRAHRPATLPRTAAPRILRLAVPHHHRRRPRLRRAPLPHPPRSVQRTQALLWTPSATTGHCHRNRTQPSQRHRGARQHIRRHRSQASGPPALTPRPARTRCIAPNVSPEHHRNRATGPQRRLRQRSPEVRSPAALETGVAEDADDPV